MPNRAARRRAEKKAAKAMSEKKFSSSWWVAQKGTSISLVEIAVGIIVAALGSRIAFAVGLAILTFGIWGLIKSRQKGKKKMNARPWLVPLGTSLGLGIITFFVLTFTVKPAVDSRVAVYTNNSTFVSEGSVIEGTIYSTNNSVIKIIDSVIRHIAK